CLLRNDHINNQCNNDGKPYSQHYQAFFGEFSFSPIEPQYFYRTLKHHPNHFHHDLKYKFQ
ncbi:hypothetical protein, partial [Neisseria sp. P0009.S007]|uniref:hypothetical protein n=1 Tax=Neisseria sp. P0009.S007 TaxID=3436714 RepID=UPI003F7E4800